tara:strand:- start:365 stop:763 length:399 start_codon:yes stop_codon:yes gene_type:complete
MRMSKLLVTFGRGCRKVAVGTPESYWEIAIRMDKSGHELTAKRIEVAPDLDGEVCEWIEDETSIPLREGEFMDLYTQGSRFMVEIEPSLQSSGERRQPTSANTRVAIVAPRSLRIQRGGWGDAQILERGGQQ